MDAELLGRIRANAALAVSEFGPLSGFDFGLDEKSVAWVEGFLERQRAGGVPAGRFISVLGSFLGEAIIAATGGSWAQDGEGNLGVAFANGDMAYPFAKVVKQLDGGLEGGESILSFYKLSVDHVATGKLRKTAKGAGSEQP